MSDELICPKCGVPLGAKRTEWQVKHIENGSHSQSWLLEQEGHFSPA